MEDLHAYCLGGGQAVGVRTSVEAMMLLRPGGEDWVGASPHGAAVGVFFLCPSVPFPSATKKEVFARRFFMEKLWL